MPSETAQSAALLEHTLNQLLDSPLEKSLTLLAAGSVAGSGATLRTVLTTAIDAPAVEQLFRATQPGMRARSSVPAAVIELLHVAAMATRIVHLGSAVPELNTLALQEAFENAMRLEWVDEEIKELLDDALSAVIAAEMAETTPVAPTNAAEPAPSVKAVLEQIDQAEAGKPTPAGPGFLEQRGKLLKWIASGVLIALLFAPLIYQFTPETPSGVQYEGYHEETAGAVVGWAWDAVRPNKAVSVEIDDGVHPRVTVPADLYRSDLEETGRGNGEHGFRYVIPAQHLDGRTYNVTVRIAGTDRLLEDSPRKITYETPK
jgi:hypothetical protein